MPAGRPTTYTPEILKQAQDYLENFDKDGDVIPSIEGLALRIKKARSTIYEWKAQEDKQEFADILEDILAKQASLLLNKGLTGDFNSNIAKLALGKHNYSEKTETDLTSMGESLSITDTERKAKIAGLLALGKKRAKKSSEK